MENKINIAELLRDCPKGMELDCLVFEDVTLYKIDTDIENEFPIRIKTKNDYFLDLTKYGTYSNVEEAKCVIFPKGKTTWKGFVPPCKFKDGDIIFTHTNTSKGLLEYSWISIFKEYRNNRCACYVCLCLSDLKLDYDKWEDMLLCELCEIEESRLATEEEKRKLFDAIKENGCYWNAETKTLDKLVEPKFKVGNKVIRTATHETHIIEYMTSTGYLFKNEGGIGFIFEDENLYELVPNKFDINNLVPFKSKVLVRSADGGLWKPAIYGFSNSNGCYVVGGACWKQCIPYKVNKELLGTTNDCDDFYKTWE